MSDSLELLTFSNPYFLLGAAIPVIVLTFSYLRNLISANRYCDKALLPWVIENNKESPLNRIVYSKIFPVITWSLFCIALAGPRINIDERSPANKNTYDSATVIVLDVSRSMLAEDIYPNRISRAKLLIDTLLATSAQQLYSLVIYANNAHTVIPLTFDSHVIRSVLKSIQPMMLPIEGSSFKSGLSLAATLLNDSKIKNKSIILISDGDFDQKSVSVAPDSKNIIKVNVFGVGTHEGQAIPLKKGGWLSFNNQPVISQLNITNLKKIALHYGGIYQTLEGDMNAKSIKHAMLPASISTIKYSSNTIIIWQQVYHWFLIPALFLYLLSTLSTKNRFTQLFPRLMPASQKKVAIHLGIGVILIAFIVPSLSEANTSQQNKLNLEQANTAYFNKNYIQSEALYKKATGFNALFGQANSLYKQKNYLNAIRFYIQAVLATNTNSNRAKALYNLANSYYIIGDYSQAINLYRDTLKYNPALDRAKINLKYAIILDIRVKRALALRTGNRETISSRAGSGTRSSRVEQGVDIGASKVTLGSNKEEFTFYNLPLNDEIANQLISRGIKYSRISSTDIDKTISDKNWNFEYTTLDMVELLVKQEKIDNFNLWKRLFEIEEGFPAPVEEPHIKPGVNPW